MKKFVALAMLLALTGCVTHAPVQCLVKNIDFPPLNEVRTAELGDTIVDKGRVHTYAGINLRNEVHNGGILSAKWSVAPGRLIAREEDAHWTYYFAERFTVTEPLTGSAMMVGGLAVSKTNDTRVMIFKHGIGVMYAPSPTPDMDLVPIEAMDKPNFRQELIYNGRVGNNVKFLYRELTRDFARPAFNQEVQYDLNESKEIGFKSARIEIVEATNVKLTYKVLSSFPNAR